jgi:GGDEF domain-containing protein
MKTLASRFFRLNMATKSYSGYVLYVIYTVLLSLKTIAARFSRLNVARKMLFGYFFCAFLMILIALFILSRLDQLNRINKVIINTDIPLVEISNKMTDALLAQELYANRSLNPGSLEIEPLFWKTSEEIQHLLKQMEALPYRTDLPTVHLATLHSEHDRLFKEGFEIRKDPSSSLARKMDQDVKGRRGEMIQLLKKISDDARQEQNEKSRMALTITNSAIRVTAGLCIGGILLGILVAIITTRSISGAIHQLRLSAEEISGEHSDSLSPVKNRDEIGDLSQAFQLMVNRLKRLEEMYLDASPLTHLPGGIAIENLTKKRLAEGASLAFCMLDLANFKSFNDRYGYARGNEVILATSRIITEAAAKHGKPHDFVGHIGGDDFVIITDPEAYEEICNNIVETFDNTILNLYDPEDRERGYIEGKTRQGKELSFPIMTISIAVVTNQTRKLKSHIEVGEIAAELKTFAKSFPKSTYVVDRRKNALSSKE